MLEADGLKVRRLFTAMDHMLKRWTTFTRFLDEGRICLSNNRRRARRARHRPGRNHQAA